jgi:hypothetical protein
MAIYLAYFNFFINKDKDYTKIHSLRIQKMNVLVFEDGVLSKDIDNDFVWRGFCSSAHKTGPIIRYIQSILPPRSLFIIPRSDGNVTRNNTYNENYHHLVWERDIEPYVQYAKETNRVLLVGVLSLLEYREPDINYVYIPLHDDFFEYGVEYWFPRDQLLPWEQRSDELVWRGGCSGIGEGESLRIRFAKEIYKYNPNTQVRLGTWWSENKGIPEELFGPHIHHMSMTMQKIYFIVDGNVIASNHMWGFATGAVPFLVSNAYCWFSEYLRPYENYIPISHDLGDLVEKIEWVKNNDSVAKKIAEGALELTRNVFSPEFQRQYLCKEISKYIPIKET